MMSIYWAIDGQCGQRWPMWPLQLMWPNWPRTSATAVLSWQMQCQCNQCNDDAALADAMSMQPLQGQCSHSRCDVNAASAMTVQPIADAISMQSAQCHRQSVKVGHERERWRAFDPRTLVHFVHQNQISKPPPPPLIANC